MCDIMPDAMASLCPPFYHCPECKRKHRKGSQQYDLCFHHFQGKDVSEMIRHVRVIAGLMLDGVYDLARSTPIERDFIPFIKETREWVREVIDLEETILNDTYQEHDPFV